MTLSDGTSVSLGTVISSGQRLLLGHRCTALVQCARHAWASEVTWLEEFPKTLEGGKRCSHQAIGPRCAQLILAYGSVSETLCAVPIEDRYTSLSVREARRLVLLGALLLNPDFDGDDVGLKMAWGSEDGDYEMEGRHWAISTLTSHPGSVEEMEEIVSIAALVLESQPPVASAVAVQAYPPQDTLTIADKALAIIQKSHPDPITSDMIGKKIGKTGASVRRALGEFMKKHSQIPIESIATGEHKGYKWIG
ncbi:MAG: hypothetical protein AAF086_02545 [Planctomycetota bacterium]